MGINMRTYFKKFVISIKKIMTEKILKILDNVRYWETCPDDYKAAIEQFLANNSQSIQLIRTAVSGGLFDKNGNELQNGDVINIHQTVNGENIFVMLDVKELDLRYGFEISYKYQYSEIDLLAPNHFNGNIEWEIIGSLASYLGHLRFVFDLH
jgi:hypothetical protein